MENMFNFLARLLLIAYFSLLFACSASPINTKTPTVGAENKSESSSANGPSDIEKKKIVYTIRPGDTLSDIALSVSGNRKNWRTIAKFNQIANPSKLKIGQTIEIPRNLILPTFEQSENSTLDVPPPAQSIPKSPQSNRQKPYQSVVTPAIAGTVLNEEENEIVKAQEPPNSSGWILVNGNYYPRELTREPDTISDIVTQVWPGTRLRFVDRINGWYKVVTDQGTGYINPDYATIIH